MLPNRARNRLHRPARKRPLPQRLTALLLCAGAAVAAYSQQMPTVELNAGIHLIHAELANNDAARMRGLMFRRTLGPNDGMLFIFDEAGQHCMWMRNTEPVSYTHLTLPTNREV